MAALFAGQCLFAQSIDVYFGTYSKANASEGIYHATLNLKNGTLSNVDLACKIQDPSYVAIHPNSKFVYAVTERDPGEISAFRIEPGSNKLTLINKSPSQGASPCHLCISRDGRTLLVANYGSGTVASIPLNTDGSLAEPASVIRHTGSSINPQRQKGPHAHSINLSPDNRFAYVTDLGVDKIMVYKFEAKTGRLSPNNPSEFKLTPGAGPRHFSFSPNGEFAYVINELDETIVVLKVDVESGKLSSIQAISTLPAGFSGTSYCAAVRVHPSGKFLYGSNRGHDSIAMYKIDPENGTLTLLGFQHAGIKTPRDFNIDPTGQFCIVANQDANTVLIFRINQQSGWLEPLEQVIKIGKPVCVSFVK